MDGAMSRTSYLLACLAQASDSRFMGLDEEGRAGIRSLKALIARELPHVLPNAVPVGGEIVP